MRAKGWSMKSCMVWWQRADATSTAAGGARLPSSLFHDDRSRCLRTRPGAARAHSAAKRTLHAVASGALGGDGLWFGPVARGARHRRHVVGLAVLLGAAKPSRHGA